jgi:SAM-dependent methyltransferase
LLAIAQRHFKISQAEYRVLDIRAKFPFEDGAFDVILSTMALNEVSDSGVKRALTECHRVLSDDGILLITVTHPDFINSLAKRGMLQRDRKDILTMPSTDGMRLPVIKRSTETYKKLLEQTEFQYETEDVFPTQKVLNAKPGLRKAGNVPLALIFRGTKR